MIWCIVCPRRNSFSDDGFWKTMSVDFANAEIASVEMQHGAPGVITTQISPSPTGSFFQATELGGAGLLTPGSLDFVL